jgi:ribosomal protein S18 acetylase RimI-like enzyme
MAVLNSVSDLIHFPNVRPLDIRKDLLRVADLIELCFANTMDQDGYEYLRQMRQAARDARFLNWAPEAAEKVAMPLSGYIWEEAGQVVGNLSLIPMRRQGRRIYLIANVAVHPDFRRRGIARALTQTALEHLHRRQVWAAWLQVRDDNPAAHHLYQSLGFIERARRTTWEAYPPPKGATPSCATGVNVGARQFKDWEMQKQWLIENYPSEVDWNLNFNLNEFKPGFFNDFLHFMGGAPVKHWAARRHGFLTCLLTWQTTRMSADNLWLAAPDTTDSDSLFCLLTQALHDLPQKRCVAINLASTWPEDALYAAGFSSRQTLIWMETQLTPAR